MNSQGFGCILAHAMGLGKTIQVCTFCDVFLRSTTGDIFHHLHAMTTLNSSLFSRPRSTCPLHRPHKHHSELAGRVQSLAARKGAWQLPQRQRRGHAKIFRGVPAQRRCQEFGAEEQGHRLVAGRGRRPPHGVRAIPTAGQQEAAQEEGVEEKGFCPVRTRI